MNKNNAKQDWLEMIKKSWTWAQLTEPERNTFLNYLDCKDYQPVGSYKQRYNTLSCYYSFFLRGLELKGKKFE